MDRAYLEIIFLCGMVLQLILLFPYLHKYIAKKYRNYFNKTERLYLLFIGIGYQLLPFIYVFSTWFSWFDYNLPKFLSFLAIALYCFGFWLFFRAFTDLGLSWSAGPDIKEGHRLVTSGMYKWVRHPIYAAFCTIAVAQIFMLQNWMVGPAFLLLAIPFYRYRVSREEQHLRNHFGEEYQEYCKNTNALFPRMDLIDYSWIMNRLKILIQTRKRKLK